MRPHHPPAPDQLLTIEQVAEHLQVPVKTLYDWCHRGIGPRGWTSRDGTSATDRPTSTPGSTPAPSQSKFSEAFRSMRWQDRSSRRALDGWTAELRGRADPTWPVSKRPSGKWRGRYRDPDGKEHSRHFNRRAEAQSWLDSVTAELVRGDYVDPPPAAAVRRLRLAMAGRPDLRPIDARGGRKVRLRVHILPPFGKAGALARSVRATVQAWLRGQAGRVLRPATCG